MERDFTAAHIAEELKCCRAGEVADDVRLRKEHEGFDVLGLEDYGVVVGYVERNSLKSGFCNDYKQPFSPTDLITESTPLGTLLPILRDNPRVFVLKHNHVSGIVTCGDLQKAPIRMWLFGLVTILEMNFLQLIRVHYPNDSWRALLTDKRVCNAGKLLSERRKRNEEIDLADCLQFADKRRIIIECLQIREGIELKPKTVGKSLLVRIERMRDKLAHGQKLTVGSSWPEVINLAELTENLLIRCEQYLETSRLQEEAEYARN